LKKTALFAACYAGKLDVVGLLLDRGAKIDHEDCLKQTALFTACCWGRLDVVGLLLDSGAKIDHENGFKQTALFVACKLAKVDVVGLLLDRGAHVNQVDYNGETPLFSAAGLNFVEIVRLLLNSGANIPFTVYQSEYVRMHGDQEMIQLLMDKNILNKERKRPEREESSDESQEESGGQQNNVPNNVFFAPTRAPRKYETKHTREFHPEVILSSELDAKYNSDAREILGVSDTATEKEIRKAYLQMSHIYHPDKVTPDKKDIATNAFAKIANAYKTLTPLNMNSRL
jgi:ankyrin repeat protein